MGGLAGHMSHLYENRALTFGEMKRILKTAAKGKLQGTEKLDGVNVFLGFVDGGVRAARNVSDLAQGGMNLEELSQRPFKGGSEIRKAYVEAAQAFEKAFQDASPEKLVEIFGENGDVFYNAEIISPSARNVIGYDGNSIYVHHQGHKRFDAEARKAIQIDPKTLSSALDETINLMDEAITEQGYSIKRMPTQELKELSNKEDLNITLSAINKAQHPVGDGNSIEDFLRLQITPVIDEELNNLPESIRKLAVERTLGKASLIGQGGIPRGTPSAVRKQIAEAVKTGSKAIESAMYPFEEAIHNFSVEILKEMQSALILDNEMELKRMRSDLQKAITGIQAYNGTGKEKAVEVLTKQLSKIRHHDNVNTTIEGFVFEWGDNTYKLTGNFAPINQILGLYKFGRGNQIPPIMEESVQEEKKKVAVFPGGFKPPHAGHYQGARWLAEQEDISEVVILVSPKSRTSQDGSITIDKDTSLKLWELYTASDPKIRVQLSENETPVGAAYEYLTNLKLNETLVVSMGEKELSTSDTRWASLKKETEKTANKLGYAIYSEVMASPVPNGMPTGTKMRNIIASGDKEQFMKSIPQNINKEEAWKIVTSTGGAKGPGNFTPLSSLVEALVREVINEREGEFSQRRVPQEEFTFGVRGVNNGNEGLNMDLSFAQDNFGIPRAEMPQIKSNLVPKFLDFLEYEYNANITRREWPVSELKATQANLNPEKVKKLAEEGNMEHLRKPILISSDEDGPFIMDGHHRWAALNVLDPEETIEAIQVNMDIEELLEAGKEFPQVAYKGSLDEQKQIINRVLKNILASKVEKEHGVHR